MQDKEYYVIINKEDLPKMNTRGGDEDLGDGRHKVWFGNGYKTSGPLGENPRELTVEEDKAKISEILEKRDLHEFTVIEG